MSYTCNQVAVLFTATIVHRIGRQRGILLAGQVPCMAALVHMKHACAYELCLCFDLTRVMPVAHNRPPGCALRARSRVPAEGRITHRVCPTLRMARQVV